MARSDPLRRLVRDVRTTDRDIRRAMRDAAAEADRMVKALEGDERFGARVRQTQARLARLQLDMWQQIERDIRKGIVTTSVSAAEIQALADSPLIMRTGISRTAWAASQIAQSRQGISTYMSRRQFNYTLSQRVYRNTALSRGYVERVINNGLLLGKGPYEIAREVKGFISPDTPGGASYAAMRLGRTEVANAFHQRTRAGYAESPWTPMVKWELSGSHPRADTCNDYAEDSHFPRGEAGVYRSAEVPDKPHPQCLCYLTPIQVGEEEFIREFKAGTYDDYVDGMIGESALAG
jgi:hypothetical protein